MQDEEKMLREIFEDNAIWHGKHADYEVDWCPLCRVFSIHKKGRCECHGSSCNCGGCEKCVEDFNLFKKTFPKIRIHDYLTDEEFAIYEKGVKLIELIRDSIKKMEPEINWKRLVTDGHFSDNDRKTFKKFLDKEWKQYEPHEKKDKPFV